MRAKTLVVEVPKLGKEAATKQKLIWKGGYAKVYKEFDFGFV